MPHHTDIDRLGARRRAAALGALALAVAAIVVGVIGVRGDVWRVLVAPLLIIATIGFAWSAVTRRGALRLGAGLLAALGIVALAVLIAGSHSHGLVIVGVLVPGAGSALLSRYALRRDRTTLTQRPTPGTSVDAAEHGVLIVNLRSGGGKAERFHLVDEARSRGIEPIVLQPGDDMVQLAQGAIDRGADVIGVAGGDGSQALVASVAMGADVAVVCVPAGTRNHFALDLGLDRDDVVGALDAFDAAVERRIDLAAVGDRVFVNNVSLGVYAEIVQSPEYRDAKRQTTAKMLPDLLGPDATPFGMHFTGPDGQDHAGAQLIQVSNNPYVLTHLGGFGTRARLDTGELGVVAATVRGGADVASLVAAETAGQIARFRGWTEWTTPAFEVHGDEPIAAGVDGEALLLPPPLRFRCLPAALRVRTPVHAPGYSPAALTAPSPWWSVQALLRAVAGRATPIDESRR